jgi:hypothetical protein
MIDTVLSEERPEVQHQGASRTVLLVEAVGRSLSFALSAFPDM